MFKKTMKTIVEVVMGLVLAITVIAFEGCTLAKISGRGPIPILLNQPQGKVEVIKQIRESKTIVFDYTSAFDVSEILSKYFEQYRADAIINVVIIVKTTPLDWFLNFITLGIANAKTFEITGQLVRLPSGSGSISIPDNQTLSESSDLNNLVPIILQESQDDRSLNMIVRVKKGETVSYKLIRYDLTNTP